MGLDHALRTYCGMRTQNLLQQRSPPSVSAARATGRCTPAALQTQARQMATGRCHQSHCKPKHGTWQRGAATSSNGALSPFAQPDRDGALPPVAVAAPSDYGTTVRYIGTHATFRHAWHNCSQRRLLIVRSAGSGPAVLVY
jgi:hypothetical protein